MTKNKHKKHKGTVAPNANATNTSTQTANEHTKAQFDSDLFGEPTHSATGDVKVAGIELFAIVNSQYRKITKFDTQITPTNKDDIVNALASGGFVALQHNNTMVFGVHFLAKRHTVSIDETTYAKGNGLQCFITPCGGLYQTPKATGVRTYKPYGMCRLLIENGYTVVEKQYNNSCKKAFLGRAWFVAKPTPEPTPEPTPKTA
jgi:hypothetical protein